MGLCDEGATATESPLLESSSHRALEGQSHICFSYGGTKSLINGF